MFVGIPIGFPFILDIMSRDIGIVGSASMDWSFTQLAAPGAVFLCLQAVTAAVAGRWQQREGHDMSLSMAAVVLGCGMGVTAAGVHLHEMSVLVAGLGGLAGVASGLAYSPVIQGVIADEPGKVGPSLGAITLATGLGAGVLPLFIDRIASVFRTLPTHLGSVADVATMEVGGKLFAAVNGLPTEVIESTGCIDAIAQGLYVVGSGSSGFAEALAVTGLAASALMFVAGQRLVVLPHAGEASTVATDKPTATNMDFHMLGIASMVSVTAGTLVLSMGPTLINEVIFDVVIDIL